MGTGEKMQRMCWVWIRKMMAIRMIRASGFLVVRFFKEIHQTHQRGGSSFTKMVMLLQQLQQTRGVSDLSLWGFVKKFTTLSYAVTLI